MNRTIGFHRQLATEMVHAYDVIEMCVSTAPAAPPMRLPILNPNLKTRPNPDPIFIT